VSVTEIDSLTNVKAFLQIPNATTSFDMILANILLPAATSVIEREVGHIIAKQVSSERHNGGGTEIWLRELPVLYVQNVEEGWGYFNQELDNQTVNQQPALSLWAYSLDNPKQGKVTRRSPGNVAYPFVSGLDNIRVDYVAGRNEVPANARIAFHALTSYWFRQSQQRILEASASQGAYDTLNDDFTRSTGMESINIDIPAGIIEMLKPNRRRPIIG
jgi:hypothetical protein